jgi:hypothetical protein
MMPRSELLDRLSATTSPVTIPCGDDRPIAVLKELIDEGLVPVIFADNGRRLELDVALDASRTELDRADFTLGLGAARLVGRLVLDDVPVRVVAEVDLSTRAGWARLFLEEVAA